MDATTIYNLALFLHIGGVLCLFAGLTIEGSPCGASGMR